MRNITKIYPGNVLANDDISLDLMEGEILAIVGENGAGKSTIMKILYGLEDATSGEIYLNGEKMDFRSPLDAIANGIGMVQQNFMLFDSFTVAENIVYGNEPTEKNIFFDREEANEIVDNLCEEYGLRIDPELRIQDCPVGLQQRAEILKVLYQDAKIIIFDEPSAVLTPQEVTELLKTIKKLSDLGKSIVFITHKLNEVMEVADRVLVMRDGKKIGEMLKKDTDINEMSYMMVGRRLSERVVEPNPTGEKVLDIKNLQYISEEGKNLLQGVDLHVNEGEVVGIAGVSGNGQTELIHIIMGLRNATDGEVFLNGENITNQAVSEIRNTSAAYIPEDRFLLGCARDADLEEVGIMWHHVKPEFSKNGLLHRKNIREFVTGLLEGYAVRYSSLEQKAGQLSGGNIQKLIVAREIEENTKLLIAAEPTRGIDIGAMEFIHDQIMKKRKEGDGVLLVSSELSEIISLSDRIYVMYQGKINGEFTREEATDKKLGLAMMGGTVDE